MFISLFALRYPIYGTLKRSIEHVELAYVALKAEQVDKEDNKTFQLEKLVAHAGGGIEDMDYLNTLEALDLSYNKGFRFIELDFEWTSDGYLVLLHDWKGTFLRYYDAPPRRYSLEEYKNLKIINGMTNLTLDDLARWIKQHPDTFIITDIKGHNIRALAMIKERFPELIGSLIPQIYHFREYFPVRELGFRDIILTLYKARYSDEAVLKFSERYPLTAVTMPIDYALTDLPQELKRIGIPIYAHTVNEVSLQHKLYANGVFGIYTDFLTP
jgi:glycerophosphoryl diester phosphodiesterase